MLYLGLNENNIHIYTEVEKVYVQKTTPFQHFIICELRNREKVLIIDGVIQTSTDDYIKYHRDLILPEAVHKGTKALVIGAGEGCTTNLLLQQGYEVTAIDIDLAIIGAVKEHLSDWNDDIYSRTNEFRLIIADALAFMKESPEEVYDYVVFDLTDPTTASEKTYTLEFVKDMYRVLKPGGVLSFQDGPPYKDSALGPMAEEVFGHKPNLDVSDAWRFGHIEKKVFSEEE